MTLIIRSNRRRPGITLLEVLIALFIMGIGMLTLLTLFPLGALSMAKALQSDRATAAAQLAAEYAEMMDLPSDPDVRSAFTTPPPGGPPGDGPGVSWPVFVDAFGGAAAFASLGASALSPGVTRVAPAYARTPALAGRWFALPDDLNFGPDATPAGGSVQRGGRYTWAYLLRRPRADTPAVVDLTVVVYAGRDTQAGTGETAYVASGARGENSLLLSYTAAQGKPGLRRGAWLLDVTLNAATKRTQAVFYRVVNVGEETGWLTLEVEPALQEDVNTVVVLDNAIEVFHRGLTRSP
jgi:type II secretory pathway pseudopilin PulG